MINILLILIDKFHIISIKDINFSIKEIEKICLAENLYVSLFLIIFKVFLK